MAEVDGLEVKEWQGKLQLSLHQASVQGCEDP